VQVEVGDKTLTVAADELERIEAVSSDTPSIPSAVPQQVRYEIPPEQEVVSPELRLLGYTVTEALPAVEKYLDQAFMQGVLRVRIIHGIGSGRLREAVTDLLDGHPLVRRFQEGDTGGGMTIVELEG
jgi:DNA mismatch repair protein MutS2